MRDRGDDWAAWVDRLPALVRDLLDEWDLTVDGALMNGFCSLVVPVLTADGERSVLKLHTDADADESDFEHLALQHWHGNGTVLLLRADPRRRAMLLERLHPLARGAIAAGKGICHAPQRERDQYCGHHHHWLTLSRASASSFSRL